MVMFRFLSRFRLLAVTAGVLALAACAVFGYPKVSPPRDIRIIAGEALIERGSYLANHVAVCIDCHSARDWDRLGGPMVEGTEGRGGEKFGREFGFPGDYYARNITPDGATGIGSWTDGEILRAFTAGVSRGGRAYFPVMPYPNYGRMDEEDARAIVAYIRTLKPIGHAVPESKPAFPLGMILPTIPRDPSFRPRPAPSDAAAYGEYVTNMAGCIDCHSKAVRGKRIEGMEFAGGFEFRMPNGVIRSSNITPDIETGIGAWSRETFIARFREHDPVVNPPRALQEGEVNTPMPWIMYAGMTDQDLGAIHDYLMTLKPVKNLVQRND